MICMNCSSTKDVIDFFIGDQKIILCSDCRQKLAEGSLSTQQIGRPPIGETRKVSITLPAEDWQWFDKRAAGNRSAYLRDLIQRDIWSTDDWSNNACLGYAILGAKKLGYTDQQIKDLVRAIYGEFDFKTVNEAKSVYENSSY